MTLREPLIGDSEATLCPMVLLSYPVSSFAGELPDIPAPKGYCWCTGSSMWLKNRTSFSPPTGSTGLAAFRERAGKCRLWDQTFLGSRSVSAL